MAAHYYAEFSISKKKWFVYEETEFSGPFVVAGPLDTKEEADRIVREHRNKQAGNSAPR